MSPTRALPNKWMIICGYEELSHVAHQVNQISIASSTQAIGQLLEKPRNTQTLQQDPHQSQVSNKNFGSKKVHTAKGKVAAK